MKPIFFAMLLCLAALPVHASGWVQGLNGTSTATTLPITFAGTFNNPAPGNVSVVTALVVGTGNTATVTISAGNVELKIGASFVIAGANPASLNGTGQITSAIPATAPYTFSVQMYVPISGTYANGATIQASGVMTTVAGNFLICGAASLSTTDNLSIADTQANVWQVAVNTYTADGTHAVKVFYAANIVGGSDTITLTGTAAVTHWLGCQEWFQVSTIKQFAAANGTAANPASGAFPTTVNDGVFGFAVDTATPVNAAAILSGTQPTWINTSNVATVNMQASYTIGDQSGTANAQFTATAGTWSAVGVDLADSSGFVANPNMKVAMTAYGSKETVPPYTVPSDGPNFTAWVNKNLYAIGLPEAGSPYPYDLHTIDNYYIDTEGYYESEWYSLLPAAAAQTPPWDPERFLFHMGHNYEIHEPTSNLDAFDYFEGQGSVAAVDGAYVFNGTTYADVSYSLYASTCPAATCTLAANYFLYLGYGVPFDRAALTMTTHAVGATPAWQYWNGTAWAPLTVTSDATNGLTTDGQVIFTPPPDWAVTTVNNGANSKYWVRLSVGTPTTAPVLLNVEGDDWYNDSVVNYNGTTYTQCAYAIDAACGAITNTIYFGQLSTFVAFTPTVGVANVGGTVVWQFWNGTAWTTFAPATDGTMGFTIAGANTVTLPTLAGWATTLVPTQNNPMFYIRAQITGQTTSPTVTQVHGLMNYRGWCPACVHVNSGLTFRSTDLEYAANPPAGQNAFFRHQARFNIYYAPNYMGANTSDRQGGLYTFPQVQAARWNTQGASPHSIYNGYLGDNAGGAAASSGPVYPPIGQYLYDVIDFACYPTCGPSNLTNWFTDMIGSMTALTTLWHNPTAAVYPLLPGSYDTRKPLNVLFNIASLTSYGNANGLRGTSDTAEIEEAASYDDTLPFDVPATYADYFLATPGGGGGTCPSGGCNIWNMLGILEFHNDVIISGNFRPKSNGPWHTFDNATIIPMATYAAYKIVENANLAYQLQPGGTVYSSNDEYYYWLPVTTTLTAPLTSGAPGQTISVADANACPVIPAGGVYSNVTWLQIGAVNGTSDTLRVTINPPTGPNTFIQTPGIGNPYVNAYPIGTPVRCAGIGHFSKSTPPPPANIFFYAVWFPALQTDLGTYNTAGWKGGNRDLAFLAGNAVSPLGTTGCGTAGCPPVERRDFTKAVVLFRPIQANTLDSETQTLSNPINLVNSVQMLTGPYYRLNVDNTIGPAITTVQLRAGEAAILMAGPGSTSNNPAITSLSPASGPVGTVTTISGTNFGAATDTVSFGGIAATPTAWSNTSITVLVPAGASTGQVIVTVAGAPSNPMMFSVTPTTITSTPSFAPPTPVL